MLIICAYLADSSMANNNRMTEPIVDIGDKIKINIKDNNTITTEKAKIISIKKSKKVKHNSNYKYELLLYKNNNKVIWKRLSNNDNWSMIKRKLNKNNTTVSSSSNNNNDRTLAVCINRAAVSNSYNTIPYKYKINKNLIKHIVAPMVGGSELSFRILCRRYGATLAYTPMMSSDKFATDSQYRDSIFDTNSHDKPVVGHFSANNPNTFLLAAKAIEDRVDAIDLNLGCPQRIAHSGHFGSFLLDPEDRPLVINLVNTLACNIAIPVFVKIRLLDTVEDTIELCKQLVDAGASLIAIHARYRVNLVGRTGPGARDGAAHLDQVKTIREALIEYQQNNISNNSDDDWCEYVPIVANGNVINYNDIINNYKYTNCDGIMCAEGLLDNPALFNRGTSIDKIQLGLEYMELVNKYPVELKSVKFHIRRICKNELLQYQLLDELLQSTDVENINNILLLISKYQKNPQLFIYNKEKELLIKNELEKKKREEGKRKAFESRMIRKAKREGKSLDYYLLLGSEVPTDTDIEMLVTLNKDERFEIWKKKYSQHCYDYHFDSNGCSRDRRCAFLHADVKAVSHEPIAYG